MHASLFLFHIGKNSPWLLCHLCISFCLFLFSSRKMRYLLPLFLVVLIIQTSVAPPVEKKNEDHKDKENEVDDSDLVGVFLGQFRRSDLYAMTS